MSTIKYKVLRYRSITDLEDKINYFESKGWERTGYVDAFGGMHVHVISITDKADDTEEITQPVD